jgi:hypothetical protein
MKNKLIGRTVYCIVPNGFYRIAYIESEEKFIIEYPKGWSISEEYNELKYGNMLSLKKRYWYVSSYNVKFVVNKTINNE